HELGHVGGALAGEKVLVDGDALEEAEATLVALGDDVAVAERVAARHVLGLDGGAGRRTADDAAAGEDGVEGPLGGRPLVGVHETPLAPAGKPNALRR